MKLIGLAQIVHDIPGFKRNAGVFERGRHLSSIESFW